jgi:hypothetical protein
VKKENIFEETKMAVFLLAAVRTTNPTYLKRYYIVGGTTLHKPATPGGVPQPFLIYGKVKQQ